MSEQRDGRPLVAITGTSGYIGGVLARAFADAGWRVIALQRSGSSPDVLRYDLVGGPAEPLPHDVRLLVHCAWDFRARTAEQIRDVNVRGTERLLAAAAEAGVDDVLLVSSMSAYAGTQQLYGRAKLACEQLIADRGGSALRLGLVWGAQNGGMIGSLRAVARLPLVPVLAPDTHQFTVHAADLARAVLTAAERPGDRPAVLGVANPRAVPFREIMQRLHDDVRPGARFRPLPVRSSLIRAGLVAVERAGVRAGFRPDSLLGLTRPASHVPNVAFWADHGVALRDFADGVPATAGRARS
jgi:nucleoside-diphosphate-sugar epimerase